MSYYLQRCLRERSLLLALTTRHIKPQNAKVLSCCCWPINNKYLSANFKHRSFGSLEVTPLFFKNFKPGVTGNFLLQPYRNNSSSNESEKKNEPKEEETKLSLFQKFRQMYRDYWYVLIPVHLATSAVWVAGFFYLAKSGVDVVALLESMNASEKIIGLVKNSSTGYVAITYALYKIATPARYAVTVGGTTVSINYLKKWGYIKPIPPKEKLKEMYQERRDNLKDNLKEKKDNFVDNFLKSQNKKD